jgi:uncharacterized glyoxalase superfamily protein PhnB
MSNMYPVVRYRDPDTALAWLTKAFGFTEHAVNRTDDGTVAHAELSLGTGMIMLSGSKEDGWLGSSTPDPLASTVSIYVAIDDPQSHYDRAKAEGATIVAEPTAMDYGSTEYSARDPEGNLWSFGTYHPAR